MPTTDTTPACTVDLLGQTYQLDLGNDLQRAIAEASDDLDSARDRLDAALTQVRNDAQHARALLRLSGLQLVANETDPNRGQSDAT